MIEQNVKQILSELPEGVYLVAAAKGRDPQEVLRAVQAGVRIVGENYVQEAEKAYAVVGGKAEWHFIGHLQQNKVKRAVAIFDVIETVDSLATAAEIDHHCRQIGKMMPVFIEVNSGREKQKSGVLPEDVEPLLAEILRLPNIKVTGVMTMGPRCRHPEELRPYFRETRRVFDRLKGLCWPNVEMAYLSMGMTDSYLIAVAEGANMVRIGSKVFGERTQIDTQG